MLRRLPGVFAAGEMLDWEAPTGGYLLQASFATGAAAGRGALKWLGNRRDRRVGEGALRRAHHREHGKNGARESVIALRATRWLPPYGRRASR